MTRVFHRLSSVGSFIRLAVLSAGMLLSGMSSLSWAASAITPSGLNTQVSAPTTLPNGKINYDITGGTRPGNGPNLFHSFGEFGVPTNNIANFLNETALPTNNILGRVTGGNVSNIFGTIQTEGFGNANLFLMNPAGFLFGPTATVNVGGMVNFTSADYLRLTDGARFKAVPNAAADALLSTAPVAAFGFLGSNPGAITVQGSQLSVTEGTGISLIGGHITIQSATLVDGTVQSAQLVAPGGEINLVSVGTPQRPTATRGGEVLVNPPGLPPYSTTGFASLGDVTVSRGSESLGLDASGESGGTIRIRGGQLEIINSRIVADTTGSGTGGAIILDGRDVTVTNNQEICCIGGENRIGSALGPFGGSAGEPGSVTITGTRSVTLTDALIGAPRLFQFQAFPTGPVSIRAPNLTVHGSRFFLAGKVFAGDRLGTGQLELLGTNVTLTNSSVSKAESWFSPVDVRILATNAAILDHMNIDLFTSSGPGGLQSTVTIQAKDIVMNESRINTGLVAIVGGSTDGGPITLTATRNVSLDQSLLESSGAGPSNFLNDTAGGGGNILVTAGKDILLNSSVVDVQIRGDLPGAINRPAGNILLGAGHNIILNESTLSADGGAIGNAGNILLGAGHNIRLDQSVVSADSMGGGNANGGNILFGAGHNVILNSSAVSAESGGAGSGGTIFFAAGNKILLNNSTVMPAPISVSGWDAE